MWALVSSDGVAPSRMVGVSASANLALHHKVQKFSSGTGSPGWSQKRAVKRLWCGVDIYLREGLTTIIKYEFNKRNFIVQSLFNYVWFCVLLYYLNFVFYCTHVRMSYVLNSYLLIMLGIGPHSSFVSDFLISSLIFEVFFNRNYIDCFFCAGYNEAEMWLPDSDTTDHNNVGVVSIDELISGYYLFVLTKWRLGKICKLSK